MPGAPVGIGNFTLRPISSIGSALCPQRGNTAQQLLKYADDAMHREKQRHAGHDRHTAA